MREQALIHGLMAIGVVAIITKIHRWDESAMLFDGGSLGEWTRRGLRHSPPPPAVSPFWGWTGRLFDVQIELN